MHRMFWLGQKVANLGRVVKLRDSSLVLEDFKTGNKTTYTYLKIEKFLDHFQSDAQKGPLKARS